MSTITKKKLVIKTRQQWEALGAPTRAAILESVTALGPCSVREIARSIGRSPELVHHHMPILIESGFVVECEPRKLARHTERLFAQGADEWVFDLKGNPELFREGFHNMARAWGRANERLLADAMANRNARQLPALIRDVTVRSETGRLRPQAKAKVREHLNAIKEIFRDERSVDQGQLETIFWSCFPIADE